MRTSLNARNELVNPFEEIRLKKCSFYNNKLVFNNTEITWIKKDDDVYFLSKDISRILKYRSNSDMIKRISNKVFYRNLVKKHEMKLEPLSIFLTFESLKELCNKCRNKKVIYSLYNFLKKCFPECKKE